MDTNSEHLHPTYLHQDHSNIVENIVETSLHTVDNPICFECYNHMKWISPPRCRTCCTKFEEDMLDDEQCLSCLNEQYSFEKIIACTEYDEYSGKIAMSLKYKALGANYIAQCLVKENYNLLKHMDYCIPIPLHIKRLFKRGYNQSLLICNAIQTLTQIPIRNNVLLRTKNTKSQGGLSQKARKENLKKAFQINPALSEKELHSLMYDFMGKNILLIDDVITTSATIQSAAHILKHSLGCNVYAACWAKRVI